MSSSYKLLFQDRRQFVFEEASEAHTTAILTLIAGFFVGSLVGVYFASLDATTAGSILLAVVSYITILTSTFSLKTNPLSVLLIFVTSLGAVLLLIYLSRVVLGYFSDSPFKLVLVFAAFFAILGELVYLWSRITWVEDTRMHQLIDADRREGKSRLIHSRELNLVAFLSWIGEILMFGILRAYFYLKGEKASAARYPFLFVESLSKWPAAAFEQPITLRNDSLKRVKICVYHRSDICCWIPVGGLTGGMYELDRGDELVFSPHWPSQSFRVKVFAHGVIDYELATHPCVTRGKKYRFIDVGKPITLLTGASPPGSIRRPLGESSSSSDDNDTEYIDSESVMRKPSMGSQSSRCGLRRVASSRANLAQMGCATPSSPRSEASHEMLMTPTSVRRAFKLHALAAEKDMTSSIAVLNESTSDVKINFYNIGDTSFVISLDAFRVSESSIPGDMDNFVIRKNAWKVFEYTGVKERIKFCMRVKAAFVSTGIELSYCTAFLGEALVARDPIVSGI